MKSGNSEVRSCSCNLNPQVPPKEAKPCKFEAARLDDLCTVLAVACELFEDGGGMLLLS